VVLLRGYIAPLFCSPEKTRKEDAAPPPLIKERERRRIIIYPSNSGPRVK
jgi:hypothetical protein